MRDIKFRVWDKAHLRYDITGFEFANQELTGIFIDGDFYSKEDINLMQFTRTKR